MARYKLKARSFINDTLVEEGTEVEFAGEPGENMEPVDEAAHAAVAAAAERRAAKAAAIKGALQGVIDPANAEAIQNLIGQVQAFASAVAGFEARIAAVEALAKAAAPDLSGFAKQSDVSELDAGMNLMAGRLAEVEGVLAELAKKADVPMPPPAPAAPAADPAPATDPAAPPADAPADPPA